MDNNPKSNRPNPKPPIENGFGKPPVHDKPADSGLDNNGGKQQGK